MALNLLVVEDNPDWKKIWDFIGNMLGAGTKISWATSVDEAETHLQFAETHNLNFDIVIADIFLSGGRTGLDLFEALSVEYQQRFLFISSVKPEKVEKYLQSKFPKARFLQKPFGAQQVVNEIQAIIKKNQSLKPLGSYEKDSDVQR